MIDLDMRFLLTPILSFVLALTSVVTFASTPPSVKDMVRLPQYQNVIMSPSGKYLALLAPFKERMNIFVYDIDERKGNLLSAFDQYDVINLNWVGDARLVFSLGQLDTPTGTYVGDGGGLFTIGRDGKDFRIISETIASMVNRRQMVFRSLDFYSSIPGTTDEILAIGNLDDANANDIYRVNLLTGRSTLQSAGRPLNRPRRWILDSTRVARVVEGRDDEEGDYITFYRASEKDAWTEIARRKPAVTDPFIPVGLDEQNGHVYIASNAGRDTAAIVRYDPVKKERIETVAAHPRFDMGVNSSGGAVPGLVRGKSGELLGFDVRADRLETTWIDADLARAQSAIDQALPSAQNRLSFNDARDRMLVSHTPSKSIRRWFLFDSVTRKLEELFVDRPWLEKIALAEQIPFRFKARDGLDLNGYIFLPPDFKTGSPRPTVLHIHGGPHARPDGFGSGFGVREAQTLASRGYVVVLPNFRVTPGLGRKVYSAGFGAIGRKMSDDHEDAFKWAVDQGYADPKRSCISGASYGGYAALQALARAPGLFKCAVAGLAVTDLEFQNTSRLTDYVMLGGSGVAYWRRLVGVKSFDEPVVRNLSPLHNAEKIKDAVFIYAGGADRRVPYKQISQMIDALEKAGNPAKTVVYKAEEAHGFGLQENRVELYEKMLKFLDEQIGPAR